MKVSDLKILISDDSILVRKKLKDFLSSLGITNIYEAINGQEAVDSYKANKPDLVFMDIIMPVKTGIEALKEILSFDDCAKVVMASSVGTQEHLKEAIEAGAYDFMQKPIDNEQVLRFISNFIK